MTQSIRKSEGRRRSCFSLEDQDEAQQGERPENGERPERGDRAERGDQAADHKDQICVITGITRGSTGGWGPEQFFG